MNLTIHFLSFFSSKIVKKKQKIASNKVLRSKIYCNRVIHDRFWFLILIILVFLDSDLNNNFSFSSEVIKVLHFNIYATSDQGMRSARRRRYPLHYYSYVDLTIFVLYDFSCVLRDFLIHC